MLSNETPRKAKQIDLTKFDLQRLKMEFESGCKYATSTEVLEQIKSDWENKEVLVPLTGSMYVPDVMKNVDNIVIDMGTGYYVEKNLETSENSIHKAVRFAKKENLFESMR